MKRPQQWNTFKLQIIHALSAICSLAGQLMAQNFKRFVSSLMTSHNSPLWLTDLSLQLPVLNLTEETDDTLTCCSCGAESWYWIHRSDDLRCHCH